MMRTSQYRQATSIQVAKICVNAYGMSQAMRSLSALTEGRIDETTDGETDQILADDALMASIARGQADAEAGRVSSWEDVKARLGL